MPRNRAWSAVVVTFHIASSAIGQSALPYAGFGDNGLVIVENYGATMDVLIFDMAEQPDGKILLFGNYGSQQGSMLYLQRLDPDGTLDESFASNGIYLSPEAYGPMAARGIAIRPDGRILLVGNGSLQLMVVQLNEDGSADTSFDDDGLAVYPTSAELLPYECALDGFGSLYVTGAIGTYGFITKINEDSSLDPSFGEDGLSLVTPDGYPGAGFDLAIAPEGYIVTIGIRPGSPVSSWYLAAVGMNGQPIPWFGNNGFISYNEPSNDNNLEYCAQMALRPDGSIITSGTFRRDGSNYTMYRAFHSNGSPDNDFGENGIVEVATPPLVYRDPGVISLLPDGDILFSGAQYGSSGMDCKTRMVRLNSDGSFETDFGNGGVFFHRRNAAVFTYAEEGGLLESGRLAVVGTATTLDNSVNAMIVFDLNDISTAVTAESAPSFQAQVYPNPATDKITVLCSGCKGRTSFTLIDQRGSVVQQWTTTSAGATRELMLDPSLANGSYQLIIRDKEWAGQVTVQIAR